VVSLINATFTLIFTAIVLDGIMKASPACIRAMEQTIDALKLAGHECIELDQRAFTFRAILIANFH
jgi:hypothetical protein